METSNKILRRSIYTFLKNYHYFTTISSIIALPFSLSILLSQALILLPSSSSSCLFTSINTHLTSLFLSAGFPASFNIITLKLSQTISSSILTLPFTLTFLLLSKATIIHALNNNNKPSSFSAVFSLVTPLFHTYICNLFLILAVNSTIFCLFFFAFIFLEGSNLLLAIGAAVYSIVLANALIISNLASAISGFERSGGLVAILKACVLIRGRTSTALSLALPCNLIMAAIEALFNYRILRHFGSGGRSMCSIVLEGIFISYLYSISVIVDTVTSCMFYKSCKHEGSWIKEQLWIEFADEYSGDYDYQRLKDSEGDSEKV